LLLEREGNLMAGVSLEELAVLLAALAIAGPLSRWLGIGTVLGYLVAGMLLGPSTIGWIFSDFEAKEILEFAEFGIVLLLFVIGLELRPKRLWAMRNAVFGLGSAQVGATGLYSLSLVCSSGCNGRRPFLSGSHWRSRRQRLRCKSWRRPAISPHGTGAWDLRCCCFKTCVPFHLSRLCPCSP
jgi:hypothetical protein